MCDWGDKQNKSPERNIGFNTSLQNVIFDKNIKKFIKITFTLHKIFIPEN